ncbi:hypothetical protein [Nocardia sp. NBC_00403]|uniref:hypothetical protein n=1 Tax=Nocardia sp. NBC_00403 TaxID=2975990 RepID=UPI002E209CB4
MERLAEAVGKRWHAEAKIRGRYDPEPLPVRWLLTERNISDHRHHFSARGRFFDERSDQIVGLTTHFLALERRRLAILGEPGAGKSTLAVQILLQLLAVRKPDEPVPVVLTLARWSARSHQTLDD